MVLLLFDFVCSFSHLNMPGVRMSDLRSVQFDVCDGDDEVVSIASDIYINKYLVLSIDEKVYILALYGSYHI